MRHSVICPIVRTMEVQLIVWYSAFEDAGWQIISSCRGSLHTDDAFSLVVAEGPKVLSFRIIGYARLLTISEWTVYRVHSSFGSKGQSVYPDGSKFGSTAIHSQVSGGVLFRGTLAELDGEDTSRCALKAIGRYIKTSRALPQDTWDEFNLSSYSMILRSNWHSKW